MAVRHGYGKIAGTDALVFAYDTGDTRNSYRGEPTTNLVTNPTFIGTSNTQTGGPSRNWYFSGDTSATGFQFYDAATAPIPLKFPDEGAVITTGPNGTSNRRIYYNGTVEPNTTYTLSYWIYSTTYGSIATYFFTYKADGTGTTSPSYGQGFTPGEWTLIQKTFTTPADTGNTRNVNWGPVISAGTNSLFAMQRFQIEANTKATPFVNGTRSATQGLLDLTGNRTIDLANVSFDSNSQVTFDGTNDYLSFPYTQSSPNLFSVETVFYHTAHSSDTNIGHILVMPYNGYNAWIYSLNGTDSKLQLRHHNYSASSTSYNVAYTTGLDLNKWYHTMATDDGTNVKLYVNGELVKTQASATSTTNGTMTCKVGSWPTSNTSFAGDIPVVKIYNRALTAQEVASNYNHYKSRFGI